MSEQDQILYVHKSLKKFLKGFDHSKRGGIHDFLEISLFNMITEAITSIDAYLKDGHNGINSKEVISIVTDSYQKVLDKMKRNLDVMHEEILKN